ncbi:MAG: DMT family transporter [Candidatus Hodarchaeota archaeon]
MQIKTTFSIDYLFAVVQALFVTVLWSSSWIIIKFGLEEIPPIIFSGFRYVTASVILLVVIFSNHKYRDEIIKLNQSNWVQLAIYGLIFITITQGSMYIALSLLPAITVSLVLNFTIFIVVILSALLLKEIPSVLQLIFILLGLIGIIIYFYPIDLPLNEFIGLIVVSIGVISNALALILGRGINRAKNISPIIITALSMVIGSAALLIFGLIMEGLPNLSLISIFYILWLSIVNTAFAFTLWNKTMQKLRAIDSTLINSAMLPQTVLLALIFLGEMPEILEWFGLFLLAVSMIVVQVSQAKRESAQNEYSE